MLRTKTHSQLKRNDNLRAARYPRHSLDDLLQELDAVDVDEDVAAEAILDQLMEEDERKENGEEE